MEETRSVAITVDDHKLAALFFDAILPLYKTNGVPDEVIFRHEPITIDSVAHYKESLPLIEAWRRDHPEEDDDTNDEVIRPMPRGLIATSLNVLARHAQCELIKEGIDCVPVFSSAGQYYNYCHPGAHEAVEITLINAQIIDTRNLDWRHIVEIRSDGDFKRKLRNFRLLLADNYKDKPRTYIIDDLHRRVEEYHMACKKHGLHLITSSLSHIMGSKSLLGFLSVSAASILAGERSMAAVSAITGAALEIGKVAINIAEKRLDIEAFKKSAGIAYLVELVK